MWQGIAARDSDALLRLHTWARMARRRWPSLCRERRIPTSCNLMQASPLWEGPAGLPNSFRRSIRGIGTAMPVAVGVAPVARMWDFFVSWIRDEFVSAVALPI